MRPRLRLRQVAARGATISTGSRWLWAIWAGWRSSLTVSHSRSTPLPLPRPKQRRHSRSLRELVRDDFRNNGDKWPQRSSAKVSCNCRHRRPIPNALFVLLLERCLPPLPLLLSTSLLVRLAHNYSTPCKLIPVFVQLSVFIWITGRGGCPKCLRVFPRKAGREKPKMFLFSTTTTSFYSLSL